MSQRSSRVATVVEDAVVNTMINKLLANKHMLQQTKFVELAPDDIQHVLRKVVDVFQSQPMLLDLTPPVKICGDMHGQFNDLLRLFTLAGWPEEQNYLFLGDYIDRGKQSIEVLMLLYCYKIKYPESFFLLRGNHETETVNRFYGFYDEVRVRYNVALWNQFQTCFNWMPAAALIDEKIFCMHGGISQEITSWQNIRDIERPAEVSHTGILCDLLWADPGQNPVGYIANKRGVSFTFNAQVLDEFCCRMKIDLVARAHQVAADGYHFFGNNRRLVTIFSAPNYCNQFDNAAAVMTVDENLVCSFDVIRPVFVQRRG